MSIDISVPLSSPLEVHSLVEDTLRTFEAMLKIKVSQPLAVQQVVGQDQLGNLRVEILTQDEDSPYVIVSLEEETKFGLMVFPAQWDGEDLPTASISPYGENRNREGLILSAACAISIARSQNSFIEDTIPILGSKFRYKPEQLQNQLQAQAFHNTIEDATNDVLRNIERAKRPRK